MSDPRLASLAQTLMSRVELDQSLGVLHIQSPRLDEAILKASLPSPSQAANPWQDNGVAVAPASTSGFSAAVNNVLPPPVEQRAPINSALPVASAKPPQQQPRTPPSPLSEPVAQTGSVSTFAKQMATHRYGTPEEENTLPAQTGSAEKLDKIQPVVNDALVCKKCGLCEGRTHVVFGDGDLDTDLMFIGEAPGREEDLSGHPFVGRAGQMLTDMIEKGMKRSRASVYITNPVKCRPPGNRVPKPDEIGMCQPYLDQQIDIIKPKVIVALGSTAATVLTGEQLGIGKLRNRWFTYRDIPVLPTYHPSYLVRQRDAEGRGNAADKAVWKDLQAVLKKLNNPATE